MKEPNALTGFSTMLQGMTLEHIEPRTDFALLRVDFNANSAKDWLKGRTGFPFLEVSRRDLEEGEPVYSFGYPLSSATAEESQGAVIGHSSLSPRVTSAIVSSRTDVTRMAWGPGDEKVYVLDKALNYGNSGGPIVASETGRVHALCSRFQPVFVPQNHLRDSNGQMLHVMVPSLYGVVSSLGNSSVLGVLEAKGVSLASD